MKGKKLGEMGNIFWIGEGILYVIFLTGDLWDFFVGTWPAGINWYMYSNLCKYAALILCVGYGCKTGWKKGQKALCGILLFAAAADYFLLFTDDFLLGILFFCMVQCCYSLYFVGRQGAGRLWRTAGIGICIVLLLWCLIQAGVFGVSPDWKKAEWSLLLTSVFYASLLLQNLIRAWTPSGKVSFWGRMGILLLFLCDIHVALYNIEGMDFSGLRRGWMEVWCELAGVLMWLFYLPSQLCIVKCMQGKSTYK